MAEEGGDEDLEGQKLRMTLPDFFTPTLGNIFRSAGAA